MSDDPEGLLREVWRVLAPSGRMMAVIPNRRGVWTRTDTTPFGHGRPYSRSQITQLLRQTWFTPTAWGEALFMPPVGGGWFLRSAMAWERIGAALSLPFAGVHIVEATKQVYRAIPAHRERTRLIPALPRETLATIALETARAAIDLRLRSGDERRQAIDTDTVGNHRLWLRLRLKRRLRTMFARATVVAGRMLLARLVGLGLAWIVVARHERLRLRRNEAGLLPEIRKAFALVVAVLRGHLVLGARLWLVLTEMLLGGGD